MSRAVNLYSGVSPVREKRKAERANNIRLHIHGKPRGAGVKVNCPFGHIAFEHANPSMPIEIHRAWIRKHKRRLTVTTFGIGHYRTSFDVSEEVDDVWIALPDIGARDQSIKTRFN